MSASQCEAENTWTNDRLVPVQTWRHTRNDQNGRNDRDFLGSTPDMGGVLCLPVENHIVWRVNFIKFQELLCNYLVK